MIVYKEASGRPFGSPFISSKHKHLWNVWYVWGTGCIVSSFLQRKLRPCREVRKTLNESEFKKSGPCWLIVRAEKSEGLETQEYTCNSEIDSWHAGSGEDGLWKKKGKWFHQRRPIRSTIPRLWTPSHERYFYLAFEKAQKQKVHIMKGSTTWTALLARKVFVFVLDNFFNTCL